MLALRIVIAGLVGALGVCAELVQACCAAGKSPLPRVAPPANHAAEKCFASAHLPPALTSIVSQFCEDYIHSTPGTVTKTHAYRHTDKATTTVSTVVTVTATVGSLCTTSITTSLPTTAFYVTRAPAASKRAVGEGDAPAIPSQLTRGCPSWSLPQQLSSACRCFLTVTTTTVTATGSARTATTTVTSTSTVTSATCSATSYSYEGSFTCGIPIPSTTTSGVIECTPAVASPSANAYLRIEAPQSGEGTIFEGCIVSGPMNISTPSSNGPHPCDGNNAGIYGAYNQDPGTAPTDQLAAASLQNGFPFDATWNDTNQDFVVTSIDATVQNVAAGQTWDFELRFPNGEFGGPNGCHFDVQDFGTVETVWDFGQDNSRGLLTITPDYQVVAQGTTVVSVQVQSDSYPVKGVTIHDGTRSDANGTSIITVPANPGCYQYKATAVSLNYTISNAFYLSVLPASSL